MAHVVNNEESEATQKVAAGAYYTAFLAGAEGTDLEDPATIQEALARPDADEWRKAITSEYKSIIKKKTWQIVERKNISHGRKVLHGKLVFKTKRNGKKKVRFVVKGYKQIYGRDFD